MYNLSRGCHDTFTAGTCLLEAVAHLAGEDHTDRPECVCPVLAAFGRGLNDVMPDDATRNKYLGPLVERLLNTRSTPEVELRRAFVLADFAVREAAPTALEAAGLHAEALSLRQLTPITSAETAEVAVKAEAAAEKVWEKVWTARAAAEAAWAAAEVKVVAACAACAAWAAEAANTWSAAAAAFVRAIEVK